jgi:hypothetical protein
VKRLAFTVPDRVPADDPERARHFWQELLQTTLENRQPEDGRGWQTEYEGIVVGLHERGTGPGDRCPRPSFPDPCCRRSDVSDAVCTHLDQIAVRELPPSVDGCEDCLRTGGKWLHLRICLTCGHVACCDDSPNRHASAHAHTTSHPIIRSLEPGENWNWCYVDEVAFGVDGIHGTTRIPPSPLMQ